MPLGDPRDHSPCGTGLCGALSMPNFAADEMPSAEMYTVPSALWRPGDISLGPAVVIHTVT